MQAAEREEREHAWERKRVDGRGRECERGRESAGPGRVQAVEREGESAGSGHARAVEREGRVREREGGEHGQEGRVCERGRGSARAPGVRGQWREGRVREREGGGEHMRRSRGRGERRPEEG